MAPDAPDVHTSRNNRQMSSRNTTTGAQGGGRVDEHGEGEVFLAKTEDGLAQRQVARTGHGQKFCESLNEPNNR